MDVKRFKDSVKADIKAEMKPRKLLRTAFVPQTKGLLTPTKEVFQVFVTLIAQIFVQAKLISKDHPSFKGDVRGFGAIWLMIIDASSNVKFKRENIYQIVVFYGIVGMLVFGVLDLAAFLLHFGLGHAHAQAVNNTASLFNETNASDNAPNWINTLFPYANNQTNASGLPFALQGMLVTYNSALLALGTAFALYQIAHLFMESAHHGKFGGNNYSQLHAPLRLVIGIGLLVPTSYGFNSAQLITIQAAKWGSGLASNVWQSFTNSLTAYNTSTPSVQASDVNILLQKLVVDETCSVASLSNNGASYGSGYTPTWTSTDGGSLTTPNGATETTTATSYVITFDDKPGDGYCGSITIPMQKSNVYDLKPYNFVEQAFTSQNGILSSVWTVANDIYQNSGGGTNPNGAQDPTLNPFLATCSTSYCASTKSWAGWMGMPTTSGGSVSNLLQQMQTAANNVNTAYNTAKANNTNGANNNGGISPDWTKAGYLFLKITHDAADEQTAQNPTIDVDLPDSEIMTAVTNSSTDSSCSGLFSFINFACDSNGRNVVVATRSAMKNVQAAAKAAGLGEYSFTSNSNGDSNGGGGVLLKALGGPLTTLYNGIQAATATTATTTSFGQSIFDVLQLGNIVMMVATAFVAIGATLGSTPFTIDDGLVLIGIGMAIFPVAFSLAIMVPLMPAGRFIFGLFTWILTLFEGVIAMPVVALISINFNGEGMFAHGKQGWFLLLQMMLRPVLMIFGLIGAVMIFDTLAGFITQSVFGAWFALNTTNTTSVTTLILGPVQGLSLIFQIIGFLYFYALTLYACANMSFGLINTIPDRILNWTGLPGGFSTGNEMDSTMRDASSAGSGMITSGAQNQIAIGNNQIRRADAAEQQRQAGITQSRNEYSMGRTGDQIWNDAHSEYEDRGGNSLSPDTSYDRDNRGGINGGTPALIGGPGGGGGSSPPSMDDMHGEALQMNTDRSNYMNDLHGEAISEDKQRDANSQQFYDAAHGEAIFEDRQRTASASAADQQRNDAMNQAHGEGIAEDKQRDANMNQSHGEAIEEDKTR